MYYPDEKEYLELCRDYKSVPVSAEWPSDTETPITLYAKLAGGKASFLLESVEGAERLGRYSFIGFDPYMMITCHRGITTLEKDGHREELTGDPFAVIEKLINDFRSPVLDKMPRFYGGAVGYMGYDMVRHLERLPDLGRSDTGVADCILMVPRINIIMDHLKHTLRVVVNTVPTGDGREDYSRAAAAINDVLARIREGSPPPGLAPAGKGMHRATRTNLSRSGYMDRVEAAKEYIKAGDILQVVLSRRIDIDFKGDPFRVYRRLRRNNPSPYLYYLDMGGITMAGSSPEMLVRVEGGNVETRPIAGTRPRGSGPQQDRELAAELLSDIKERAEHVMLVDLGRNDLGRVCKPGTVKVQQFMEVELYSHVMHIVSSVRGELKEGLCGSDVLKACFPAGTVSGAPKVRAMEIIEELEPSRRGPYAGAVGYIGFNGNVDTAIAIRTIVFHQGLASVQVGAGIVADSDPAREFIETENKAGALLMTLAEEEDGIAVNY
ncbi:MAG: anthranilate synthase [Peptococcaceae bacterium BRH_c4a]|nr:MAG: anthranilate synthase [Peptococcaceae bacterium BRH_c4a]